MNRRISLLNVMAPRSWYTVSGTPKVVSVASSNLIYNYGGLRHMYDAIVNERPSMIGIICIDGPLSISKMVFT